MSTAVHRGAHADGQRAAAVLAAAAAVYFAVRKLVEGTPELAARNADRLMRVEHAMGIDVERSLQKFTLGHPALVEWGNHTYVWLHWPFLVLAFVVLFARDRSAYQKLRDTLFASGALGLVIFAVFPAAPPRLMPGFVGTVSQAERQHFVQYPASWANRVASMPSFHVGWTLVAAILLASTFKSHIVKVIAFLPGPLVAIAVVTTGNHYVIDVIIGSAVALTALHIVSRRSAETLVSAPALPQPAFLHATYRLRR
ncbi:MAG: phosphatase PAP2 family protein [Acidimicrobiales bacterium]